MILVTGGCGFIGSNFIRHWLERRPEPVLNVDLLTYSANPRNLKEYESHPNYRFIKADITDAPTMAQIFTEAKPRAVVHFAAESHVDQSIANPQAFVMTNVVGTYSLLEASRKLSQLSTAEECARFRFLHVSTDEVYGSLSLEAPGFNEATPYAPNSPYSASKAGSDHMVRAYGKTYGLPTLITHCSNNYGPYQFAEKLIPLMIAQALRGQTLPVYGRGENIRDWLYVLDHCEALERILDVGRPHEVYNIGGGTEVKNIDLVYQLCRILDRIRPRPGGSYANLIQFVTDRLGHDFRYSIDPRKLADELNWQPRFRFSDALESTIAWYVENQDALKTSPPANL